MDGKAKTRPSDFAIVGGPRLLEAELPVGQLYFPPWDAYEREMRSIFSRDYYTNHGPLVRELEQRLEAFLGVRHALTVSNATVGLYLVTKALDLSGSVIVPAFTFVATAQAMSWAGVDVAFCEVEADTHQISPLTAEAARQAGATAVVGVNLWGGSCGPAALQGWAESHGLELLFDSAHAFGCETNAGPIGRFGHAEVFSFHATKVVSSMEGGCIATDDDELAEQIRNMRSNYGIRSARDVPLTINARMSEAQAAVAMLSLSDLARRRSHNEALWRRYQQRLASVPGISINPPASVTHSNYQSLVCEVDEAVFGISRDGLRAVLKAEGVAARRYFFPGVHRTIPYCRSHPQSTEALPVTDSLCARVLQLPIGARVKERDVDAVSQLIADVQTFARDLAVAVR